MEQTEADTSPRAEDLPAEKDLLRKFYHEVGAAKTLSREDEEALATRVAQSRNAILELLRQHPDLVRAALGGGGKGVVDPAVGFREREAVRILAHIERQAAAGRRAAMRRLAAQLARQLEEYRRLRDAMIAANLRLVVSLARRYRHPSLSQLDLIQEGTLGLIRAVERYEPQRGIKFSTYAVWWIWQQLARAADNLGNVIRTPVHWNQFRRKTKRSLSGDIRPNDSDLQRLAAECGVPAEYARAMEQGVPCVPLEGPIGPDGEGPLASRIPGDPAADPAVISESRDLGVRVDAALAALPPRESEILRLRFGLVSNRSLTLEEIGQRYGVSRERIRQLEARAMQQMREICSQSGLQEYLH